LVGKKRFREEDEDEETKRFLKSIQMIEDEAKEDEKEEAVEEENILLINGLLCVEKLVLNSKNIDKVV